MGKKYMDTKAGTLESSILGVWKDAAEMKEQGHDGRTKSYKEHRAKLEAARARREEKKMDKVNPKALKKDFDDRKDKDIDNDGDVDDSDEYLHNRRKTVSKAVKKDEAVKEHRGDKPHKHPHEEKEVEESYEIGTDEYRDHTLEVTPGQSLTWGSANAYKAASMKEALAKVWGLDEKKLDKTEEDDKIAAVKGKKTMTGGDVAEVEVDPEKKEK